ncbi:MAG: GNAT family N-acetyltransferase [Proteobacteria bacterium]|nr:GNAT family N-acetyltransferase [Pseudomonadota bacterium]MDA1022330.1 GNAT family N-acetyltransferase [Pseudomonadota bacterium]
MSITITEADGERDLDIVRELFVEYQKVINVDLCFQDFEKELAEMPGNYAPPKGGLFLAREDTEVAAVVGVRPLEDGKAEMKRLYVRPGWRGRGLGRRLVDIAVSTATKAGYRTICLDTLEFMDEARALYRSMGFREIPAYYDNPLEGVVYMELSLE